MATPGPIRQKIKARITRTKAVASDAAKAAAAPIKREVAVAANSVRDRMPSDNTLGYVQRQTAVSARKADRAKRRYENNVSNPNSPFKFKGEGLPNKRRKAIAMISENANTKLEGRERRKWAKEQYKNIVSKPQTDAERRKRDARLQSRAIIGNTSVGAGSKTGVARPGRAQIGRAHV